MLLQGQNPGNLGVITVTEYYSNMKSIYILILFLLGGTAYGQTRGGETLLASARPIGLKVSEAAYPVNFTVISASALDQISSSIPDLKHGIFSYYLMKGLEGDADLNNDGKINAAEMQEYLTDMVGRQAMSMNRKQHPQLFGDADKLLVGK